MAEHVDNKIKFVSLPSLFTLTYHMQMVSDLEPQLADQAFRVQTRGISAMVLVQEQTLSGTM